MTATLFRRFAIATLLILIAPQLRAVVISHITSQGQTLGATRYEILFVTSGETTATSSNIADYNNFVSQAQALTGSGYPSAFVPSGDHMERHRIHNHRVRILKRSGARWNSSV